MKRANHRSAQVWHALSKEQTIYLPPTHSAFGRIISISIAQPFTCVFMSETDGLATQRHSLNTVEDLSSRRWQVREFCGGQSVSLVSLMPAAK